MCCRRRPQRAITCPAGISALDEEVVQAVAEHAQRVEQLGAAAIQPVQPAPAARPKMHSPVPQLQQAPLQRASSGPGALFEARAAATTAEAQARCLDEAITRVRRLVPHARQSLCLLPCLSACLLACLLACLRDACLLAFLLVTSLAALFLHNAMTALLLPRRRREGRRRLFASSCSAPR